MIRGKKKWGEEGQRSDKRRERESPGGCSCIESVQGFRMYGKKHTQQQQHNHNDNNTKTTMPLSKAIGPWTALVYQMYAS